MNIFNLFKIFFIENEALMEKKFNSIFKMNKKGFESFPAIWFMFMIILMTLMMVVILAGSSTPWYWRI